MVREDLVEHIDVAAFSLAAAGIPIPAAMQGRGILAAAYRPRAMVYAARDRCDETVDRIRSVRTDRFLYIRNFHHGRPSLQPNAYRLVATDGAAGRVGLPERRYAGATHLDVTDLVAMQADDVRGLCASRGTKPYMPPSRPFIHRICCLLPWFHPDDIVYEKGFFASAR